MILAFKFAIIRYYAYFNTTATTVRKGRNVRKENKNRGSPGGDDHLVKRRSFMVMIPLWLLGIVSRT